MRKLIYFAICNIKRWKNKSKINSINPRLFRFIEITESDTWNDGKKTNGRN